MRTAGHTHTLPREHPHTFLTSSARCFSAVSFCPTATQWSMLCASASPLPAMERNIRGLQPLPCVHHSLNPRTRHLQRTSGDVSKIQKCSTEASGLWPRHICGRLCHLAVPLSLCGAREDVYARIEPKCDDESIHRRTTGISSLHTHTTHSRCAID